MRKKLPRPVSIASVLPRALKRWRPDKKALLGALDQKWPTLVGVPLALKTSPFSLKGETLWIGVPGPSYANELQFLQTEILKKIGEEVPALLIKKIRFKVTQRDC